MKSLLVCVTVAAILGNGSQVSKDSVEVVTQSQFSQLGKLGGVSNGADLDEEFIRSTRYGPGLIEDPDGFMYDAKNPPPCTSNCAFAYPKGHSDRTNQSSLTDTEYFEYLISSLSSGGRIYIFPGYYEVGEIGLLEDFNIIGLYDASAVVKAAVFSGFMTLKKWKKSGSNLWSHAYPFSIANYDSNEGGAYFCKDPLSNVCKYAQDLIVNGIMQTQWECAASVGCIPPEDKQWFLDRKNQPDTSPDDNFILLRSAKDPNTTDTRISHLRGAFKEGAKNVRVRNINFKGYTLQSFMTDDNWVVTNCTFEKNGVTGLSLRGRNVFVSKNLVSENGCTGMQGKLTSSVLRSNKVINNNVMGHKPGMHAGGIKLITAINTSVEKNYVLDNEGAGIWVDIGSNGVEVHHNLIVETKSVQGLQARGIQYEMSSGNTTAGKLDIHNNVLKVEGGVAGIICIYALNSQYLEIFNNTIRSAQNGIVIKQDSRGYAGNCANGYPGCVACPAATGVTCDNKCVTGGNVTDDPSSSRCMQQVREIQVYYNDVSVGGSGYLLTGFLIEPGAGQTGAELNGITPARYYNKNVYKVDIDYNTYNIPGNPAFANSFQWTWDNTTQSSKRLVWEQANDFVDQHSCINGMCASMPATLKLEEWVSMYPNPFQTSLFVSLNGLRPSNVIVVLIGKKGERHILKRTEILSDEFRFDTSLVPEGQYIAQVNFDGSVVATEHVIKE